MNDICELCIEKHLYEAIAAALHVDDHRVRVGTPDDIFTRRRKCPNDQRLGSGRHQSNVSTWAPAINARKRLGSVDVVLHMNPLLWAKCTSVSCCTREKSNRGWSS